MHSPEIMLLPIGRVYSSVSLKARITESYPHSVTLAGLFIPAQSVSLSANTGEGLVCVDARMFTATIVSSTLVDI